MEGHFVSVFNSFMALSLFHVQYATHAIVLLPNANGRQQVHRRDCNGRGAGSADRKAGPLRQVPLPGAETAEHVVPLDSQPAQVPRHVPQVPRVLSRGGAPGRHLRVRPHEHGQHLEGRWFPIMI